MCDYDHQIALARAMLYGADPDKPRTIVELDRYTIDRATEYRMTPEEARTVVLRGHAAALGWDPEERGPVDEATDEALDAFSRERWPAFEPRRFKVWQSDDPAEEPGVETFSLLVACNLEDFGTLAWLETAEIGEREGGGNSLLLERVK